MSSVSFDSTSFYSSLFGTSSSSSTNSLGLSGMLSDYASIRNGSYSKLLKAHYAKQEAESSGSTDEEKEATKKAYSAVKSAADSVSSALSSLQSSSLYQKGEYQVTSSSGEKTDSEYDYDAVYEKLSAFVEGYNSLLNSAGSENATSTNHLALNMASSTSVNMNLLSSIGISQDEDGQLSIDRDKFNESDLNVVKNLFQTNGGYGDSVGNRASMMASIATNKLGTGNYTSSGTSASSYLDSVYSSTV